MTTSGSGAAGHRFHPTILREYDVRGIVDETLFAADALALGRAFATIVRAGVAGGCASAWMVGSARRPSPRR